MNRALPAVRLRVPTHEDAFVWHRLFDDPDVMEFHGGRAAELSVYEELTARQRRHDAELGFCLWSMVDESGQVIAGGPGGISPQIAQHGGPALGAGLGAGGPDRDRLAAGPGALGQGLCHRGRAADAGADAGGRRSGCGGDGGRPQHPVHRGRSAAGDAPRRDVHDAGLGAVGALLPARPPSADAA
jgi:hypothetical protein